MKKSLDEKYELLKRNLKKLKKTVVAYSGGVDSTFLLKTAIDVLGAENVLACIGVSSSLSGTQYKRAIEFAELLGAKVEEIKVQEIYDAEYAANSPDRCFHCKSHLYSMLNEIARKNNFHNVICGCNFDDKDDFRPGNKAADIRGILSPLMEVEMTKDDIRKISRKLNLPTSDLPASPCLASRIAYGLKITRQRLEQIEEAEDFLRELGFVEFRVRHHDTIARIEVNLKDLNKIISEPNRQKIINKLKSIGFKFITIDLQGFRSGSLNETLTKEQKQISI
ncbi:MAG: ATP-dependent sacrificial sulfur transferase LarE [Sedimentisphaerales bacterium]|nr:ATP-dependent sacrificial sulfur transferase LarE [Sedimentisphaerales bacterium]